MGFKNSLPISMISICDAKCNDQTGRIMLVDCAYFSFQRGDWELNEKGLMRHKICGQKALCCAVLVVKVVDSTHFFFLGELIFHNIYFLFSKEIQLCTVWLVLLSRHLEWPCTLVSLMQTACTLSSACSRHSVSCFHLLQSSLRTCSSTAFGLFMFSPFLLQ